MSQYNVFRPIRSHSTLRERTYGKLVAAIFSGKFKPGEKLNESQLARQLKLSRAPVREALHELQEQGLAVRLVRRGMFVVSLDREDVQKINALRVVLEAEALRLARKRVTPKVAKHLTNLVKRMENLDGSPAYEQVRVDLEFHRSIWALSGNEYLERVLNSLTAPLFAHATLIILRIDLQRAVLLSHRPLLDFALGKSRERAEDVMVKHLSVRWEDPSYFTSFGNKHSTHDART